MRHPAKHPERDEIDIYGLPRWVAPDSKYSDTAMQSPFHDIRYPESKERVRSSEMRYSGTSIPVKKKWVFFENSDQLEDENITLEKSNKNEMIK